MLVIDHSHVIESISDNGLVLLQQQRDQIVGRKCYEVVHGLEGPPAYCPLLKTPGAGDPSSQPASALAQMLAQPLSIRCMALCDEDGAVLKVLGLTETAAAPATPPDTFAREATHQLQTVLDTVPHAVIVTDTIGSITSANLGAGRVFKTGSADDLTGRSVYDLVSPAARLAFREEWRKTLVEGSSSIGTLTFLRTDAEHFPGEFMINRLKDSSGHISGIVVTVRDVTGRHQRIEHISIWDAAVKTAANGIVMIDFQGKLTYANDASLRMWGFGGAHEVIGKSIGSLWQPANVEHEILSAIEAKGVWAGEVVATRKDGATFDVQAMAHVVYDEQGRPLCIMASMQDVTEAKRNRSDLEESRAFISGLLDNSHHPILVINPDTSIRYVNSALERLTGFTFSELVKRKAPYPWAVQDSMPRTARDFRVSMSRGPKWYEELYRKKDGKHFWVEVTSAPVLKDGRLNYYMASWVDITDRRLIEEELTKERDRQRTYLDTVGVMVATVDAHGSITMANKKACETLGYEEKQLVGQSWYNSLVPQRDRADVRRTFRTIFTQHSPNGARHSEGVLLTRGGEEKLFTFTHTLLRVPGRKSEQLLISGVDTTELHKTQEQLEQSHLLASLGEMTAGIAHEVNNPLGSILLYSELLMTGDVPPQIKKDLKVIHDEAKRAAKIMTDLLIYGRRTKPQIRRVSLNSVIKKVMEMRRYQHKVMNITTIVDLDNAPLFVKGDSSQLMQVAMNFVLNAEDALRDQKGGTITVTSRSNNHWARITVSDDGPGIPPENLKQIFYPFFTTKPVGEGTGLGLSICYGIVTAHSGLIRAESGKKGGATFIVELPLANGRSKAGAHAAQTEAR